MSISSRFDAQGCLVAPSVTAEKIKKTRKELGMTQEEFAKEFSIPLGTLRDWEQGARSKSRASQLFAAALTKFSPVSNAATHKSRQGQLTPG